MNNCQDLSYLLLSFVIVCDMLKLYFLKRRTSMAGIVLDSDEYVLAELNNAQDGSSRITKLYHVTLTNKRIIAGKIGALGKEKLAYEKNISDVKVFDGIAQVKVSSVYGTQTRIDIYLSNEQLSFSLSGAGNADAIKFANELNRFVTGTDAEIYSEFGNDTGFKAFKKSFFGTNSVEAKKQKIEKVAIRCPSCAASFEGIKGKVSKCPYCGSVYNS